MDVLDYYLDQYDPILSKELSSLEDDDFLNKMDTDPDPTDLASLLNYLQSDQTPPPLSEDDLSINFDLPLDVANPGSVSSSCTTKSWCSPTYSTIDEECNEVEVLAPNVIDIGADVTICTSEIKIEEEEEVIEIEEIKPDLKKVKLELLSSYDEHSEPEEEFQGPLRLSDEEKRLLKKEGYPIPKRFPLTKEDERNLKKIRRKIRNKQSAQQSRNKRKQYIDSLEYKFKLSSQQNEELQRKVRNLEKDNKTLVEQMKRIKAMLLNTHRSAQSTTCAMVILLSMTLLLIPNYNLDSLSENSSSNGESSMLPNNKLQSLMKGSSRSLLYSAEPYENGQESPMVPKRNFNNKNLLALPSTNGNKSATELRNKIATIYAMGNLNHHGDHSYLAVNRDRGGIKKPLEPAISKNGSYIFELDR